MESFQTLFPCDDCIEDFEASWIHKIVLGILSRGLAEELHVSTRAEVNVPDTRGRSALSGSALRGDHQAVSLLLEAGADKNTSEIDGNTPLLFSTERGANSCMKLLLKAGANATHRSHKGRDALFKALENHDNPHCIKRLLAAGISVDTRDSHGASPLSWAALRNHVRSIPVLLDCRADINLANQGGDTPLMESLCFNSDDVLKLLLEAGADYTKEVSYGDPILHDVAIYGGLRTIDVVRAAKLPGIDINATNKKGKTALQLVQQREEKPDGFVEAFQIMLDAIRDQRFEGDPGNGAVDNEISAAQQDQSDNPDTCEDFVDALEEQPPYVF